MNGYALAAPHSLVSRGLKVHILNWLAASALAQHIRRNDLITIITLMEAFFFLLQEGEANSVLL